MLKIQGENSDEYPEQKLSKKLRGTKVTHRPCQAHCAHKLPCDTLTLSTMTPVEVCGDRWRLWKLVGEDLWRPVEAYGGPWKPMEVYGSRQRPTRTGSQNYMVIEKDNSCLGELQLEGRLWSFLIVPNSLYGNSVDSCACGCARPFRPHTNTLVNREREFHFLDCSRPVCTLGVLWGVIDACGCLCMWPVTTTRHSVLCVQ